jgi:hypothetical protein
LKKCITRNRRRNALRAPLRHVGDAQAARVRGDDASAFRDPLELLEERALGLELLDDGLDDEIAVFETLPRSSSTLPTVTRRARSLWKNAAGFALRARSSPPAAKRFRAARSFFSRSLRDPAERYP